MEQYKCQSCGAVLESASNHCPFCGAAMNGGADGQTVGQAPAYPNYTPAPPAKKQNFIVMLIGGILLCLFGIGMLAMFLATDIKTPVNFSEVSFTEAKESEYICFDKLVIVDIAAEETEETSGIKTEKTTAYLVLCYAADKDGAEYAFPMYVSTEHSELTDDILDYYEDENAYIGDFAIKAAVKVTDFSNYPAGAESTYKECYGMYKTVIGAASSEMCVEYAGDDGQDLIDMQKSDKNTTLAVGGIFLLLGALLVFLYFVLKKKAKADPQGGSFSKVG